MNDDPIFITDVGYYRGRSDLHLLALISLVMSRGMHVVIVKDKQPSTEEITAKLVQEFKLSTEKAFAEPFFPKESAWERRNSNAPWYRRFQTKRRRS